MYDQCLEVGSKFCLPVHYEDLVLHPRSTLKKILEFNDMPWHENVMEHEKHMDDISLSAVEKSTDQVRISPWLPLFIIVTKATYF